MKTFTTIVAALLMFSPVTFAQTTTPVTDNDPLVAIGSLRKELIDSFNVGDVARLVSHLDDDVVITWQNGEVCRGPGQVRAYYDKMMTGPDRIVQSARADPQVTDRHVYGNWAVSWGEMNDHFVLNDGSDLAMNSKFTATIAKRGDEWKVTSFHVSVNAFDNSILKLAIKKTLLWSALGTGVVALLIGIIVGRATRKKSA